MKIIVIGKHGQIAKSLQDVAENHEIEIIAFGKDEVDIRNTDSIEELIKKIKPDVIINTAAYFVVSECEDNPDEVFQTNVTAVYHLTKLCKQYNILFITYSTDYVFDGKKHQPYEEDDIPNPLQIYGTSKVASEYITRNYYPEGSFVIRTNGVFGGGFVGSSIKKSNFVLGILHQAKEKKIVEVASEAIVSPTYAKDLADATLQLIKKKTQPNIYHLVNEGSCSWQEFAQTILEYSGSRKSLQKPRNLLKENVARPNYSALVNTRAKKLGIILPSWKQGLRRYLTEELGL